MAQTTILAAAQTAAPSSDVVVTAGSVKTIGLFVASGIIPSGFEVPVMIDTPGADTKIASLNDRNSVVQLPGPGTFRALRPSLTAIGVNVGIFLED